ncbi:hypothetical protein ACCUM_0023 [Candidatus Accumulibacter phosphatis]|uniref:Uncharacterized protein n=1 Tax=Candidatus Accumulibacter phosphatis TaxID=327160 RepID=A0A5S4ELK4_9PROT|nr:hypothetical protein ACCUM_0023 [Candidatus Accumulibacter phosphatis]
MAYCRSVARCGYLLGHFHVDLPSSRRPERQVPISPSS